MTWCQKHGTSRNKWSNDELEYSQVQNKRGGDVYFFVIFGDPPAYFDPPRLLIFSRISRGATQKFINISKTRDVSLVYATPQYTRNTDVERS